jgi:hypothetical protein
LIPRLYDNFLIRKNALNDPKDYRSFIGESDKSRELHLPLDIANNGSNEKINIPRLEDANKSVSLKICKLTWHIFFSFPL